MWMPEDPKTAENQRMRVQQLMDLDGSIDTGDMETSMETTTTETYLGSQYCWCATSYHLQVDMYMLLGLGMQDVCHCRI